MMTDADKSAYDLWSAGWTASDAGQSDEARALWARAAEMESDYALYAMGSLGKLLVESGPDDQAEGMAWLERAAGLGHETAAFYLAMEYRSRNDPAAYLQWMTREAELGSEEAELIVRAISRRIAAGRDWPMYIHARLEWIHVWCMLGEFRDGKIDAPDLVSWARAILERRTAVGIGGDHSKITRDAIRALADGDGGVLTTRQAKSLLVEFDALAR
jgi:hypothetical protein